MDKEQFFDYLGARLVEPSTWQGIGFVLTLFGCKWAAEMEWGQVAGLGGIVSAAIKVALPDKK